MVSHPSEPSKQKSARNGRQQNKNEGTPWRFRLNGSLHEGWMMVAFVHVNHQQRVHAMTANKIKTDAHLGDVALLGMMLAHPSELPKQRSACNDRQQDSNEDTPWRCRLDGSLRGTHSEPRCREACGRTGRQLHERAHPSTQAHSDEGTDWHSQGKREI